MKNSIKKPNCAIIFRLSIGLTLLCLTQAYGQSDELVFFRHVKGMQGLEISCGISDLGTVGSVFYTNCLSRKWYGKSGIIFEFKDDPRFFSWALTADISFARTMVSGRNYFFSLIAGGSIVIFEEIKGFEITEKLKQTAYGPMVGLEFEYYLGNRFATVVNGISRYILNSDIGKTRIYGTAGLKFIF